MGDMKLAITPKSDQLNADDLIGGDMTITITRVDIKDAPQQPVSIFFEGDGGRPYKPCKSMCKLLVSLWGDNSKEYTGNRITLYREPQVTWGGQEVVGIRISAASGIDAPRNVVMAANRSKRISYQIEPLKEQSLDMEIIEMMVRLEATANAGSEAFKSAYFEEWKKAGPADQPKTMTPTRTEMQKHLERLKVIADEADEKQEQEPEPGEIGDMPDRGTGDDGSFTTGSNLE